MELPRRDAHAGPLAHAAWTAMELVTLVGVLALLGMLICLSLAADVASYFALKLRRWRQDRITRRMMRT